MNNRFTRFVMALVAVLVVRGPSLAHACSVCFGAEDSTLVGGTKLGVWAMLAVTVSVEGAFVGFFLYLRRRAKLNARVELDSDWSNLQKAAR